MKRITSAIPIVRMAGVMLVLAVMPSTDAFGAPARRPNILLIMTDDQGYGDLGAHGNTKIKTPHLDRFVSESVRLKNFYVSPVCSPTRASLLTGRYNFRTGVVDTYIGRSMMHPDEVTMAEILKSAGYRTGIFGKWHLGDNAPLRPIDQGFEQALVIKGGGLRQAANPTGGDGYNDPILEHNGHAQRYPGYCSDIYTTAAIEFVSMKSDRPSFTYLAFNCPHVPLEAPPAELAMYQGMNLAIASFPQLGQPIPKDRAEAPEDVARVYAMITNIDTNIGRILKVLDDRGLSSNTIVVFLTDNGPAAVRFNAGLRGWKGSVFDGGIKVPGYIRWPGHLPPGRAVEPIAAHIDILPTLLEACDVPVPPGLKLDGKSLLPLMRGTQNAGWPDRTLFFQWHRGDRPEVDRAFAARSRVYKLLRREPIPGSPKPLLELFDMEHDPLELENIAARHPDIVTAMHKKYLAWFKDVCSTRGFDPIRIELGGSRENPSILTRQDWRGPLAGWKDNDLGYWEVQIARACTFDVTLHFLPRAFPTVAHLSLDRSRRQVAVAPLATECKIEGVAAGAGPGRLEVWIEGNHAKAGVLDAKVERVSD